jgi:shikimate kinase
VELVGPAGAGKTTLARTLSQHSNKIVVAPDISLRRVNHLPTFVYSAFLLLPIFLQRCRCGRWFTWDEVKAMAYLKGWPHLFQHQAAKSEAIILLDHGPIFKLATLQAFGPDRLRKPAADKWWSAMYKQWASQLDMVIWLDASDLILEQRINGRDQRHAVKGKPQQEALRFLARYRTAYQQILARLTADGGPILHEFDTGQTSIEQIAEEILAVCNCQVLGNRV